MMLVLDARSFRIRKFSNMFRMMQGLNGPTRSLNPCPNANLNPFWFTLQPEGSYACSA